MDHNSHKFRFTFKLAARTQIPLIHTWLDQEHIKEWLHGVGLKNTLEDLEKFFKGTSFAKHWIAYEDNIPFGYLLTSEEGKDVIALDLFICDLNYLGKGLSVQMIQEFLISQFPNIKEVLIEPEATNARAIHVYEKVGFKKTHQFIAKWLPVPHDHMRLEMKELLSKKRN